VEQITLRGMTWAHRRAIDPLLGTLDGFRAQRPDVAVEWSSRPLHGFEFTPVDELARRYDLIILDHPFCGDIAATGCLMPLDALATGEIEQAFVGPSLASYRYGGHLWALPVDAACQVGVARPDLLDRLDRAAPRSWDEMLDLGRRARSRGLWLAIGLKGVHSLMTFFTLCANLGRPCAVAPDQPLADRDTARAALAAMRALLACCPPESLDWNSIALHDAMTARDDLAYCPAVYCYATYAEDDMRAKLRFADLPGLIGPDPRGSTIGGAGIGVSAGCAHGDAAFDYISYLMTDDTQREFARHHGQPATASAWEDPDINARFGDCYEATRATIEAAWIRPRYPGYLAFQAEAGALIEQHLRGEIAEPALLDRLAALHRADAKTGAAQALQS
jgi:multiple sugar transport system substrate-binding protein